MVSATATQPLHWKAGPGSGLRKSRSVGALTEGSSDGPAGGLQTELTRESLLRHDDRHRRPTSAVLQKIAAVGGSVPLRGRRGEDGAARRAADIHSVTTERASNDRAVWVAPNPCHHAWFEEGALPGRAADTPVYEGRRFAGSVSSMPKKATTWDPPLQTATTYNTSFVDLSNRHAALKAGVTIYDKEKALDVLLAAIGGDPRRQAAGQLHNARYGVTEHRKEFRGYTPKEVADAKPLNPQLEDRRRAIAEVYRRVQSRQLAAEKAQRAARRAAAKEAQQIAKLVAQQEAEQQRHREPAQMASASSSRGVDVKASLADQLLAAAAQDASCIGAPVRRWNEGGSRPSSAISTRAVVGREAPRETAARAKQEVQERRRKPHSLADLLEEWPADAIDAQSVDEDLGDEEQDELTCLVGDTCREFSASRSRHRPSSAPPTARRADPDRPPSARRPLSARSLSEESWCANRTLLSSRPGSARLASRQGSARLPSRPDSARCSSRPGSARRPVDECFDDDRGGGGGADVSHLSPTFGAGHSRSSGSRQGSERPGSAHRSTDFHEGSQLSVMPEIRALIEAYKDSEKASPLSGRSTAAHSVASTLRSVAGGSKSSAVSSARAVARSTDRAACETTLQASVDSLGQQDAAIGGLSHRAAPIDRTSHRSVSAERLQRLLAIAAEADGCARSSQSRSETTVSQPACSDASTASAQTNSTRRGHVVTDPTCGDASAATAQAMSTRRRHEGRARTESKRHTGSATDLGVRHAEHLAGHPMAVAAAKRRPASAGATLNRSSPGAGSTVRAAAYQPVREPISPMRQSGSRRHLRRGQSSGVIS